MYPIVSSSSPFGSQCLYIRPIFYTGKIFSLMLSLDSSESQGAKEVFSSSTFAINQIESGTN